MRKGHAVTTNHASASGFLGNLNNKKLSQPPVENETAQGSTCGLGKKSSELPGAHVLLTKGKGIRHDDNLNMELSPPPVPMVMTVVSSTLRGFKRHARSTTAVMANQRPGGRSKRKLMDAKGDGQQRRAEGVQKKGRKTEDMSVNATDELAVAMDQPRQQP
jgi:hypothetical protein